jgi:hypothetical protein
LPAQLWHLPVIWGALCLSHGLAHPRCAGGFHYPPAKHHYAFAKSRTEIQASGEANFDVNH